MTEEILQETIPETIEENTYVDLCLKFPDKDTFENLLFVKNEQQELTQIVNANIDCIGIIFKSTGEILQGEDGEYPEMKALDGWHVNLKGGIPLSKLQELSAFIVVPESPVRVWA